MALFYNICFITYNMGLLYGQSFCGRSRKAKKTSGALDKAWHEKLFAQVEVWFHGHTSPVSSFLIERETSAENTTHHENDITNNTISFIAVLFKVCVKIRR